MALKGNGKTIKNGGEALKNTLSSQKWLNNLMPIIIKKSNEMNGVLMNEMTLPSRHRIRNMTFNYQNCTTRNAVKPSSKIWITLVSIFICVKCFLE